jgi:hypothetical protein
MPNDITIAAGAIQNDASGSNAGHVRVFTWNGSAWIQKGLAINGEAANDNSGSSVSMPSEDIVAIGAAKNDANGTSSGQVKIFKWNGTSWIQKGSALNGVAADYEFGRAVSMPDSNLVAVSAKGDIFEFGEVYIYQWNGTNWVQKGSTIVGESATDLSGIAIDMPDTNTIAIGSANNNGVNGSQSGHVRVFRWSGTDWQQKGLDLDGEAANNLFGSSVSMADSNNLAVGANWNEEVGAFAGHARVFEWNGSAWI